jgi:hypothetical protein
MGSYRELFRRVTLAFGSISIGLKRDCEQRHLNRPSLTATEQLALQDAIKNAVLMLDLRGLLHMLIRDPALARYDNHQVVNHLEQMVRLGKLCLCNSQVFDQVHGGDPVYKILGKLASKTEKFQFESQTFRLVDVSQWRKIRIDSQYQVMQQDQARQILSKLAVSPMVLVTEKKPLLDAMELLADVRQSLPETGIVLLRFIPMVRANPTAASEIVSPSQLAKMAVKSEKHWIEIKLVDADNNPIPHAKYRIQLPDASYVDGLLDENGLAWIGDLASGGSCKISFPEIDAQEWN